MYLALIWHKNYFIPLFGFQVIYEFVEMVLQYRKYFKWIWTKQSCPPIEELFFGIQQFSQEFTLNRYLLCSRSVQKMSKKEKKLENIKQHWLSYPLFICALIEFFWSPENLQFLWFSIFLMCLLVSVCFVWCWIYLWDHLTNNWHFRAYIIKGFCDGWGGGGPLL